MAASSTVLGPPERGASESASIPSVRNRSRQVITVGRDTPSRLAIADVPSPPAAASTILARSASPADTDDERVQPTSVVFLFVAELHTTGRGRHGS